MIVIADQVNAGNYPAALPLVETALARAPEDEGLNLVKLGILENLGDQEAVGTQLAEMVRLYPDRTAFADALIRWHMDRGDTAGAEQVLRAQAARTPDDPAPALRVVQFLLKTGGADAARAEVDRLAAAAANPVPFQRTRAAIDFADGRHAEGIASLRGLIDATEPSDDRRDAQVMLARMLGDTGDAAGRDALVDAILAENPRHVEALKLRARREIDADKPELAVQDMRTALEQAPRDAAILTLMAEAHEREGAHELAGDRLALAVEVSGKAPEESLRYARFLMQDNRLDTAESVIVDALKLDRQNRDLLFALGQFTSRAGTGPVPTRWPASCVGWTTRKRRPWRTASPPPRCAGRTGLTRPSPCCAACSRRTARTSRPLRVWCRPMWNPATSPQPAR